MKKKLLGIAGVLAMISSANAVDTAQIKAACQSSDKTLWVESNQVCIPRNPCENPNYEQYCNRDFANMQVTGREYEAIVNIFAEAKKLDCKAVEQNGKVFGEDYVVCMGNDVMVFKFDDINEHFASTDNCLSEDAKHAVCIAVDGRYDGNRNCFVSNGDYDMINMINKHVSFGEKMGAGDYLPFAGWDSEESSFSLGCPSRFM